MSGSVALMVGCSVEDCGRKHSAHGLCHTHYERRRRNGDVGAKTIVRPLRTGCEVPGCDSRHSGQGYCQRHHWVLVKYGLDPIEYERLVALGCAICGGGPRGRARHLSVDHDEGTGVVRGVLCQPCNTGIGLLAHDVQRLRQAISYLEGAMTP